jgi:hypothetical protein
MAANPVPQAINDIFRISKKCQTAANTLGAGIPLMINTSSNIGSNRGNLLQLEGLYQGTLSGLPALRSAVRSARANAIDFARKARGWLENSYGHRWNEAWRQVGFIHDSLEIPTEDDAELAALLERMEYYFAQNPTQQNPDPKVNVTAARAGQFAGALSTAESNLDAKERLQADHRLARDGAKRALRKRLSGLIGELKQRIGDRDPRWLEFGLNLPSAPNVPKVPKNVAVNTNTANEFFITCAPAQYATHYRFFTQRPGLDPEPVHAGNSDEPMFHLAGLAAGQNYTVLVTAANAGAESSFGKAVTAVVSGVVEAVA